MDRSWYALPVAVLAGTVIIFVAPTQHSVATILAITAFCIILWVGNPVPPWFVGLLGIGLIGISFSPNLAFIGFQSPATWLIVFGLIIGEATNQSGLGEWFKEWLLGRVSSGTAHDSVDSVDIYRQLLIILCFAGLMFTLLLPSALVRVLMFAPLLSDIKDVFDSRRAQIGIFLGPLIVTWHASGGVLTASLPNIVTSGILESTTGQTINWSFWILVMFPVTSLARAALITLIIYVMYRPAPNCEIKSREHDDYVATGHERQMLLFLLVGVMIWATDFIHGLHPLFGALLVVVLTLSPRVGVIEFDAVHEINFSLIFFVGAVFAIASGLQETGFTNMAANSLLSLLPGDLPLGLAMIAVFFVTSALMLLIEGLALASVMTPIVVSYAQQAGLPVVPIVLSEALALDTSYFFPYQSMVLVAILGLEDISAKELIRTVSIVTVSSILLLIVPQILFLLVLY
ncbi:SLC13 family permease [Saliphagus sp. GCM10025334]